MHLATNLLAVILSACLGVLAATFLIGLLFCLFGLPAIWIAEKFSAHKRQKQFINSDATLTERWEARLLRR